MQKTKIKNLAHGMEHSCVWDRKTEVILFSIFLGSLYTVMSLATLPLGFFFIYTAWQNIATEVHLLDNYITNALK